MEAFKWKSIKVLIVFQGTTSIDGNDQPIIGKREANSTITVSDKEIAILAGLQQNEISDSGNYFPFIGRLPLLKKF